MFKAEPVNVSFSKKIGFGGVGRKQGFKYDYTLLNQILRSKMYFNNRNKNSGGSFYLFLPLQKEHEHNVQETSRNCHPTKQLVFHLKSNNPFPESNVYVSIHNLLKFSEKNFKSPFSVACHFP